jgi:hypothetical protein
MVLRQVIEAIPALNKLADTELDIKSAYKVSKILSALKDEVEFFNLSKQKIIEKYGNVNDDGSVDYAPGKQAEAQKEFSELINLEVQTEIEKIELSAEGIKLTANDILALEPFVTFKFDEQGD